MVQKRSPNGRSEGGDLSHLTEDERRALRGSKFAPLPSNLPSSSSRQQQQPRLAHPGGPMATNKAAALAKFLERKLQQPGGLDSINPELLELAVKNAKEAVNAGGSSGMIVRHVVSFDNSSEKSKEAAQRDESKEAAQRDEYLMPHKKKKKKKQRKTGNLPDKLKPNKKKRKKMEGSAKSNSKKHKK